MVKKSITYTELFTDEVKTEDFYFHLSKADLIEMEMSHKGGLHEYLQRIVASEDGKAIITEFKDLILTSYGVQSEDGRRFIKTPELRDEFLSSEAYSSLFMELCTNAEAAADFVNGIVPAGLEEEVAKLMPGQPLPSGQSRNVFEHVQPNVVMLTPEEVAEMDSDELKSGLATGRYKLAP